MPDENPCRANRSVRYSGSSVGWLPQGNGHGVRNESHPLGQEDGTDLLMRKALLWVIRRRSGAKLADGCWNSGHNGVGWYRPGYNRTCRNDGSLADGDSGKNDGIGADPDIRCNHDGCGTSLLQTHQRSRIGSMIVIDETTAARNEAVISDDNPAADIELASGTDKAVVSDADGRSGGIYAVKVEVYVVLKATMFPNRHLVRPRDMKRAERRTASDTHTHRCPPEPSDRTDDEALPAFKQTEGKFGAKPGQGILHALSMTQSASLLPGRSSTTSPKLVPERPDFWASSVTRC